jgi:hypothetical protein
VKNLFVGNLGSEVTHEELRRLFEAYGEVVQVHIIVDRGTGLPRGFAFVEMSWSATQWHASPRHVSALTNDTATFRQRHNVGALGSRPLGKTNFVYFQAAAATRGTVIMNGLWCSKARSRWPTIVYFGL